MTAGYLYKNCTAFSIRPRYTLQYTCWHHLLLISTLMLTLH